MRLRTASPIRRTGAAADDAPLRIIDGRARPARDRRGATARPFAYDYDARDRRADPAHPALLSRQAGARLRSESRRRAQRPDACRIGNDAAAAVPAQAYRDVDLQDVVASGPLSGPHVKLVDRQPPSSRAARRGRARCCSIAPHDGFEDVNAYFHIDRTQRHLQSLGYTGRARASRRMRSKSTRMRPAARTTRSSCRPRRGRAKGTLHLRRRRNGRRGRRRPDRARVRARHPGVDRAGHVRRHVRQRVARAQRRVRRLLGVLRARRAARWHRAAIPSASPTGTRAAGKTRHRRAAPIAPGSDCLRRLDSTRTMADYERDEKRRRRAPQRQRSGRRRCARSISSSAAPSPTRSSSSRCSARRRIRRSR